MLTQTRPKNVQVSNAQGSPSRLFWAVILTLMVAQISAFWLLCSQQVRKAEVRDATVQQERMALADCLGAQKSTVSSCVARAAALQGASPSTMMAAGDKAVDGVGAAAPGRNGPLAVSFTVR